MKNDRANDMNGHSYVTYRFMNEIVVTNESKWVEHMYVMFANSHYGSSLDLSVSTGRPIGIPD
jgi:hypothetical protein